MYKILVFALLASSVTAAPLKIPRIYNALISSDENLSPSHTYPIVEPVLRTTALGVAFPPLVASPPIRNEPKPSQTQTETGEITDTKQKTPTESDSSDKKTEIATKDENTPAPQLSYHGTLYPLSFDPYLSYAYSNDFLFPALPYYEHPVFVDLNQFKTGEKGAEMFNPVVNFKKNPEIPDVPPPPLPITKDDKNGKQ